LSVDPRRTERNDKSVIAEQSFDQALRAKSGQNRVMAVSDAQPFPVVFDDEDLRKRLTPLQYEVTQHQGTEYAFSGELWNTKTPGVYHCVVCGQELFRSTTKYDSGTGWPSFWAPVSDDAVITETDTTHGMVRIEARCGRCGAHLGHVFPDGPAPTRQRYCMNSASLELEPEDAPTQGEHEDATSNGSASS
jgi:peptide-methionine (R)-S-oxide reductase